MLWPIYSKIEDAWTYCAGRPALRKVNTMLFRLGARGLGLHNYKPHSLSGETAFLKNFLAGKTAPVVFDVGANEGNWSRDVLRINPSAKVYAFEPHPETFKRMASKLNGRAFNVGVAEKAGTLTLKDYAGGNGSYHASFVEGVIERVHKGTSVEHMVDVVAIDEFAAKEGIQFIDLLKIDVEGMELSVLRGAQDLLAGGRVGAVQFEFNEMNVLCRSLFSDFHELLATRYRIYRLLPHGLLPLDEYNAWSHEQFVFQNIVAMAKSH